MNMLKKKFGIHVLGELEARLKELNKISLAALGEVKEIRAESKIVAHKFMFIPVLKDIDLSKINTTEVWKLEHLFEEMCVLISTLPKEIHELQIVDKRSGFKKEDERLLRYIQSNLIRLYETLQEAKELLRVVLEIPLAHEKEHHSELTEEDKGNWYTEIEKLIKLLALIRKFSAQIEHYSEFLEKRIKQIPFIDARRITKKKAYTDFFNSHYRLQRRVIETENRIETFPEFSRTIHEILRRVVVRGNSNVRNVLHARISSSTFRIIYLWDASTKHLKYVTVVDHNVLHKIRVVDW